MSNGMQIDGASQIQDDTINKAKIAADVAGIGLHQNANGSIELAEVDDDQWFTAIGTSLEVFALTNTPTEVTEVTVGGLEQKVTTHYTNTPPSKDVALTYKPTAGALVHVKYKKANA